MPNFNQTARQNAVAQKLPESYQNLAQFNPYENMQYTQSFWDKVAGMFGFKTGKQQFEDEMHNNAQMYDAQLLQSAREEEYNSAPEQAHRLREAGINPDLQSGSVSPGDATGFDNQATVAPETPDGNEAIEKFVNFRNTRINQVGSMVMQLMDIGVKFSTFANQSTEVLSKILGVERDNILNNEQIKPLVHDIITNGIFGDEDFANGAIFYEHDENGDLVTKDGKPVMRGSRDIRDMVYNNFVDRYPSFDAFWSDQDIRDTFHTKSFARRAYKSALREVDNPDFLSGFYQTLDDYIKNKTSYNKSRSSRYFASDDGEQQDILKGVVKAQDELVELALDLNKDNISTQKKINAAKRGESGYTEDYYKHMESVNYQYKDENGNLVKVSSPSGAELQADHDKGKLSVENLQQSIDKDVERIFKEAIDYYKGQILKYPDDREIYQAIIIELNNLRVRAVNPLDTVNSVMQGVNAVGDSLGGQSEIFNNGSSSDSVRYGDD